MGGIEQGNVGATLRIVGVVVATVGAISQYANGTSDRVFVSFQRLCFALVSVHGIRVLAGRGT